MAWIRAAEGMPAAPTTIMGRSGARAARGGWRLSRLEDGRVAFCDQASRHECRPGAGRRGIVSTRAAAGGTWHHVAVTRRTGTVRLYLDGVLEREAPLSWTDADQPDELTIGADVFGHHFAGLIDEVAFYDHALAPAEIASIVHNAASASCTGIPVVPR